jgi:peptidoglycan/xylan/chitin deacetylase (PgdA/CDA1 family)
VRALFGQVAAALVVLLAAGYLLQANDSAAPAAASPAPTPLPIRYATVGVTSDRDYFVTHEQVVPLGRKTLYLPILMYHYIRKQPSPFKDLLGYNLSVSPQAFQAQVDWLSAHGYHTVDFNDIRAYFAGTRPLPSKPVVISLDDGYRDLYTTAFPILQSHGFKAVAYIVSGFVGNKAYVTTDMILQMDHYGFEIAGHTVDHANLAHSSLSRVLYELAASKQFLESLVGHPVIDFAYPSGKFNGLVISALRRTGYDTAVTEQFAYAHSPSDRFMWARVRVGGGESMTNFVINLGPVMPSVLATAINVETASVPQSASVAPIAIEPN